MIGYAYLEDLGEGIGDPSAHEEIDFFSSPSLGGSRKGHGSQRGGKNKLTSANALQPRRRPRFPPNGGAQERACANEIHGYNIVQADATYFPLDEASRDVYTYAAAQRRRPQKAWKKPRAAIVGDLEVSRYQCVPDDYDNEDDEDDVDAADAAPPPPPQQQQQQQQQEEEQQQQQEKQRIEKERAFARQEEEEKAALQERFDLGGGEPGASSRALLQEMVVTTWQDLLLYALSGLLLIFFLEQVFQMGLNAPRGAAL